MKGYKAIVVFDGSLGEKLDENQNINGSRATTADVTVYGPRGKDEISNYV